MTDNMNYEDLPKKGLTSTKHKRIVVPVIKINKKDINKMTKTNKTKTPKEDKQRKCVPMDGLAGIAMLFIAISIGYLIAMLWLLTRDWHYLVGGTPAALGAAYYLLEKSRS